MQTLAGARRAAASQMILFVTSIIKSRSEILVFAFEAVIFAPPIINSVLEIINSESDTIIFGFQMIKGELNTIISVVHMIIVKASIAWCVPAVVLLRAEIIIDKTETIIDAIVAVFSKAI